MNCEICGEEISGGSAFTCTYCSGHYCPKHRLPFNHACKNLAEWKKSGAPGKKGTRMQKKVTPSEGVLVRRKNELIIAGAVCIALLILLGIFIL